MFTYDVILSEVIDFDGSLGVTSYRVSREKALAWMKSDRFLDLQITLDTVARPKAKVLAYDEIPF